MDNNSSQNQHLVKKLLVILSSGLVAVLVLGILLYLDEKQGFLELVISIGSEVLNILFIAGGFLALFTVTKYWYAAKRYLMRKAEAHKKLQHTVTVHINSLLFAILMMALLVSSQAGVLGEQQFFLLALSSAVMGILLARVWAGLSARKSEA